MNEGGGMGEDTIFSIAITDVLFNLKIWARGSFEIHGQILNDMLTMVTDKNVGQYIHIQSMFDSLQDLYGGGTKTNGAYSKISKLKCSIIVFTIL